MVLRRLSCQARFWTCVPRFCRRPRQTPCPSIWYAMSILRDATGTSRLEANWIEHAACGEKKAMLICCTCQTQYREYLTEENMLACRLVPHSPHPAGVQASSEVVDERPGDGRESRLEPGNYVLIMGMLLIHAQALVPSQPRPGTWGSVTAPRVAP